MNDVSLKAKLNNMAKEKNLSPQLVLQNYLFERFLLRLERTKYQEKFVIKGGVLISSLVGISNRVTMDLDTTIKNLPLTIDSITEALNEICDVGLEDGFKFTFIKLEPIRKDDMYGGYRAFLNSVFGKINANFTIDISTGDIITPGATLHQFKKMLEEGTYYLWSYNMETILAEKLHAILSRNVFTTRPRDFYDVYSLTKLYEIDNSILYSSIYETFKQRDSIPFLINWKEIMDRVGKSDSLKSLWKNYQKQFDYAKEITFENTISAIIDCLESVQPYFT